MQEELSTDFLEPSLLAKVTISLSTYKAPNDLFLALFKAHKVEEEMAKVVGFTRPLPINPDLWKAVET